MEIRELASSPRVMRAAMDASRIIPEGVGHGLAGFAAGLVSRIKPTVFDIVQANVNQVLGPDTGRKTIEETAREVFDTAIRGYFDLYRAIRLPHEKMISLVDIPEESRQVARSLWNRDGGAILVFPHLGNFDLGGHAIANLLPEMQLFTLPDPPPGFQLANDIRRRTGIHVTPLSSSALRQAIKLLRRGGIVSIAGDRPVSEIDEPVTFFGQPARVPSGHIRLALKTGAVVSMAYSIFSPETKQHTMILEPPIELIRTGDRDEDAVVNMRRVLDELERIIATWLDQWQMFVPVWPELLEA